MTYILLAFTILIPVALWSLWRDQEAIHRAEVREAQRRAIDRLLSAKHAAWWREFEQKLLFGERGLRPNEQGLPGVIVFGTPLR